jgi:hypothetical protein
MWDRAGIFSNFFGNCPHAQGVHTGNMGATDSQRRTGIQEI